MTRFYTGLPKWALFVQVFSLLSSYITPSCTKITLQDELIRTFSGETQAQSALPRPCVSLGSKYQHHYKDVLEVDQCYE